MAKNSIFLSNQNRIEFQTYKTPAGTIDGIKEYGCICLEQDFLYRQAEGGIYGIKSRNLLSNLEKTYLIKSQNKNGPSHM